MVKTICVMDIEEGGMTEMVVMVEASGVVGVGGVERDGVEVTAWLSSCPDGGCGCDNTGECK